jgi:Flp pilus assembly protein CpaB
MAFGKSTHFSHRTPDQATLAIAAAAFILSITGATWVVVGSFDTVNHNPPFESTSIPHPMRPVLVPVRDIDPNTPLTMSLFRVENRPAQYTTQAAVRSEEELRGRFAGATLVAGEPVLSVHLSRSRAVSPLSPRLTGDSRAVTIHVTDVGSVDGMVRPGDIVDVAWLYRLNGSPTLKVIVQNARVLGADRQVEGAWRPGLPAPGTITLLVSPRDARYVQLASLNGTLSLALRGPDAQLDPEAATPLSIATVQGNSVASTATSDDCRGTLRMSGQTWCVTLDGSIRAKD